MNDQEKATAIIIMVPLIICGSILGYSRYTEYTYQKMALSHWEYYSFIRSNAVEAPELYNDWVYHSFYPSCSEYPIQYMTMFEQKYTGHVFLMPWGTEETYWMER